MNKLELQKAIDALKVIRNILEAVRDELPEEKVNRRGHKRIDGNGKRVTEVEFQRLCAQMDAANQRLGYNYY